MKMLSVLGLVLAFAAATAQKPVTAPMWPQEPKSFLGIQFGQPLKASIPECPTVTSPYDGATRYDWVDFGRPCFEPGGVLTAVHNEPPFFNVYIEEIDGKVECIMADFHNRNSADTSDAETIAAALAEKFGAPYSSAKEIVHNNAGAAFENKTLTWRGPNVTIKFESVGDRVDRGNLFVYTSAFTARAKEQEKQNQDAVKGVL